MDVDHLESELRKLSDNDLRAISKGSLKANPRVHTLMSCAGAFLIGAHADCELSRRRMDGVTKAFEVGGDDAVRKFLDQWEGDEQMDELKALIVKVVTDTQGLKATELVVREDVVQIILDKKFMNTDIPLAINELIEEGRLVEVEYVLPDPMLNYRIKSFLLPAGSKLGVQQCDLMKLKCPTPGCDNPEEGNTVTGQCVPCLDKAYQEANSE